MPEIKRWVRKYAPRVVTAAGVLAATAACGSGGEASAVRPEVVAQNQFRSEDGCDWTKSNPQPFFNAARKLIIVDSRCTPPAADPVGIYNVPGQDPYQKAGEPLLNGDVVGALCIREGEHIQNEHGVGTTQWVELQGGAKIPNTHVGFIPETGSVEAQFALPGETLNKCAA